MVYTHKWNAAACFLKKLYFERIIKNFIESCHQCVGHISNGNCDWNIKISENKLNYLDIRISKKQIYAT